MKQALELFSFYGKGVNGKLIGILEKTPEDQLRKDLHTYYKSILEEFLHMTMSDFNWLKRLRDRFSFPSLVKSTLLQVEAEDLKARIGRTSKDLFAVRREIDALYGELIGEIREEDLEVIVNYKNKRGDDMSKKLGHILMHLFNHQTHHRGEISAMLDIQSISNDYSGMLNYL